MRGIKPGHWKALVGGKLRYACLAHYDALKLSAFEAITDIAGARERLPEATLPAERDSASVWCSYCREEQHV